MDFLNRTMAQVAELFRSMTLGARITAVLLLVLVVVSLAYLVHGGASGGNAYLMGGRSFAQGDVNRMLGAFAAQNLTGYEVEPDGRIRVPRGKQNAFMGALAAKNALPQDFLDYLDAGANENSLSILTNKDQRNEQSKLRRQRALSAFIREMPGVETALVLPAEKLKPGGFLKETETRANVAVKMRGSAEMDEALAESIRKMVAMSFAGMKLKDVCVVDNHGRTFGDSSDDTGGSIDDSWRHKKDRDEKSYREKIRHALSWIPEVDVQVNADLDKEQSHVETEMKPDAKPVPLSTTEKTTTRTHDGAPRAARPAIQPISRPHWRRSRAKVLTKMRISPKRSRSTGSAIRRRRNGPLGRLPNRLRSR